MPSPPASIHRADHADRPSVAGSYEQFVDAHAEQFRRYLQRILDRQAEGRGGRIGVEDTLQDALLRIYERWPDLEGLPDRERDRRLYRCLRDAAGNALRDVYGDRRRSAPRPRLVAFDFDSLEADGDEAPSAERELTAAVLGSMVREIAAAEPPQEARAMVNRGMLVAGLRALTDREAVVLIAVDHLGWDQQQLAKRLGVDYVALRQTLFLARKIFYALVRHATGLEIDEEERGALAAYRAGELTGAHKRSVARHLKHCRACQALDTQRRVFGHNAAPVLAPLPFLAGSATLAKRSTVKATVAGAGGTGLFGQPGAAKAAAVVMGILGLGAGTAAMLAAVSEQARRPTLGPVPVGRMISLPAPTGMRRMTTAPGAKNTKSSRRAAHRRKHHTQHHVHPASTITSSTTTTASVPTSPVTTASSSPSSPPPAPAPATAAPVRPQGRGSSTGSSSQSCEFFCG